MQSLFKNVIESEDILPSKSKSIDTNYVFKSPVIEKSLQENSENENNEDEEFNAERLRKRKELEEELENYRQSCENIAASIIQKAKKNANNIVEEAIKDGEIIKNKAYEDAMKQGKEEGFQIAYNEGIEKVKAEGELIREEANKVLLNSNLEVINYLESKKESIKNFILQTCETILKKEISSEDSLDNIIFDIITKAKDTKLIVIKVCNKHAGNIKSNILDWKSNIPFNGEIFVVEDNNIKEGCVTIEKDNGKVVVDIENVISKLEEIINLKSI